MPLQLLLAVCLLPAVTKDDGREASLQWKAEREKAAMERAEEYLVQFNKSPELPGLRLKLTKFVKEKVGTRSIALDGAASFRWPKVNYEIKHATHAKPEADLIGFKMSEVVTKGSVSEESSGHFVLVHFIVRARSTIFESSEREFSIAKAKMEPIRKSYPWQEGHEFLCFTVAHSCSDISQWRIVGTHLIN